MAATLFAAVWHTDWPPVPAHLLKALELSGNYVCGAFGTAGEMVGASAAFAGVGERRELHSHITGVLRGQAGSGVGYALKLHQRAWALERGIEDITWTFDPLVRRNAVFNLAKLAASPTAYLENVYGAMDDVLNASQESDRLWVSWKLASPEVVDAADGRSAVSDPTGLPVLVEVSADGGPLVLADDGAAGGIVRLPPDIEALRLHSPETARQWRLAVRKALGGPLRAGSVRIAVTEEHDLVLR
ncbi:MAG: GNAT family N-acetyltransferase [Acidimicrobiales bacterium]